MGVQPLVNKQLAQWDGNVWNDFLSMTGNRARQKRPAGGRTGAAPREAMPGPGRTGTGP